jgi:mannan endo-1,4-beta-mannosidase
MNYPLTQLLSSIMWALFAVAVLAANPEPDPKKPVTVVVDDFESYASTEELAKQWYNVWHGGIMHQSLEPIIKNSGMYSMKCAYSTTKSTDKFYSPICRVSKWDLTGCNAIQFWLKPDGSGRELTIQFNIANKDGKNIHDLWEFCIHPKKDDTSGQIIVVPFSELVHNVKYADAPDVSPVFKPEALIEVALYICGINDEPGDGVYYFDDIVGIFKE